MRPLEVRVWRTERHCILPHDEAAAEMSTSMSSSWQLELAALPVQQAIEYTAWVNDTTLPDQIGRTDGVDEKGVALKRLIVFPGSRKSLTGVHLAPNV